MIKCRQLLERHEDTIIHSIIMTALYSLPIAISLKNTSSIFSYDSWWHLRSAQWIIENGITKFIDSQLNLFSSEPSCTIKWSSSKQVIPLFKYLNLNTQVIDEKTGKFKDSVDAKKILLRQQPYRVYRVPF